MKLLRLLFGHRKRKQTGGDRAATCENCDKYIEVFGHRFCEPSIHSDEQDYCCVCGLYWLDPIHRSRR